MFFNIVLFAFSVSLNPASLLRISEFGYLTTKSMTDQVSHHSARTEFRPFVKWKQLQCYQGLYQGTRNLSLPAIIDFVNREIKVSNFPQPIGNKSQEFYTIVQDSKTNDVLLSTRVLAVNVDTTTRKSAPYNEHLKQLFNHENCSKGPEIESEIEKRCIAVSDLPQNVLCTKLSVVNARQIDYNGHLNQGNYMDFVFDCLAEAVSKGMLPTLAATYPHAIELMSLLYLKECKLGDEVLTTMAQDESNLRILRFHLRHNDGLVCQAEIMLF